MMVDVNRKQQWQSVFDTLLNSMDERWMDIDMVLKWRRRVVMGDRMFCTIRSGYSIFDMLYQPCVVR